MILNIDRILPTTKYKSRLPFKKSLCQQSIEEINMLAFEMKVI